MSSEGVCVSGYKVEASWNVMAHTQKPDFVFWRNERVHLKRWGRQFSRLLAAEVCASAVVMLDTPCSEVVWRVLATHCIRQFPLHFPSLRHRVPSHFNWSLPSISVRPYPCLTTSGMHITSLLRPMILPSVSCLALQNVPHYLINGTIFARTHTHTHTHTHTQSQTSVHELNSFLKVVRKPKFS